MEEENLIPNSFISGSHNLPASSYRLPWVATSSIGNVVINDNCFLITDSSFTVNNDIKEKEMENKRTFLEENSFKEINSILAFIYNTFSTRSTSITYFVTSGKDSDRTCFYYLKGLSSLKLSLVAVGLETIVSFISTWTKEKNVHNDWFQIPDNIIHKPDPVKCNTISNLHIKANKIVVYKWGFEILSEDGVSLHGVLNYMLTPDAHTPQKVIAKPWKIPFASDEVKSYPPIGIWTK